MTKKKYTHMKALKPELLAMKESGKAKRESADQFGLKTGQGKALLKRLTERK